MNRKFKQLWKPMLIVWFLVIVLGFPAFAAGAGSSIEGVSLNEQNLILVKGKSAALEVVTGSEADMPKKVTWSSDNEKVASVSKGKVKGVSVGKAVITASCDEGVIGECAVTVNPKAPVLGEVSSAAYNKLKITWKKVSDVDGYIVYRKNGSKWKQIAEIKKQSTNYYTDSVGFNKNYSYTVAAWKKVNGIVYTSSYDDTGIRGKTVLPAPKMKSVSAASSTSMKITWAKATGASGYIVYRKTGSGSWEKIKTITKNSTITYTDKGLKKGTKYTYTVKSYRNSDGKKVAGKYDKKGISCTYLTAPVLLSAKAVSSGNKITWKKVKGATGYIVYRKDAAGSKWVKKAAISGGSKVSWTDKKAVKGKSYVYAVRATAKNSKSGYDKKGLYCVFSQLKPYAYAADIINEITTSSMSRIQKLKACHNWYKKNTSYERDVEDPLKLSGNSWINRYATQLYSNRKGNCYRHACAFAYMASALGYTPKVVIGTVHEWRAAHSWVEITINGTAYVFDPELQFSWERRGKKYDMFKKTYQGYPFPLNAKKKYSIPLY